ncbi:MAG: ABC transporter substrate-binding protein [Armatimonadota bacterium]
MLHSICHTHATKLWVICLASIAASCALAKPLKPVSLALQWSHQSQFAGYYMALKKGFYKQEGLNLRLIQGGPNVRVGQLLKTKKADFGCLMLSSGMDERAHGIPLIHLAQVVNRSNFLMVAWRETPDGKKITKLADLDGRKVTIWTQDFRAPYLAMFAAHSIKPVILPQYSTFSLFMYKGVDAFAGMRYNEYHTLLQSGVMEDQLTVLALKDYGANLPEDSLFCLEAKWKSDPGACKAFVRASMKGWRYARDHAEETLDVVMRYVDAENLPTNRPHMAWMLKGMVTSIFPGKDGGWKEGILSREAYAETRRILSTYAGLKNAPKYDEFVVGDAINEGLQ